MRSPASWSVGGHDLAPASALGQSVWIDFLSRDLLESGALARAIADDAVVGVTSNPTIFAKALSGGNAYDEQIATRAGGVHNGIEYGLMAAYAEGLNILHRRTPVLSSGLATPRPRRFPIASTTATRSTWPRSRRCGGAARWSPPGCST
jgi:hypothetical protein